MTNQAIRTMTRTPSRLAVMAAGIALAACGGSGTQTAGIDGTGATSSLDMLAVGAVTGFGSVFVNGIRFDTSGAIFEIDGDAGVQDDLAVGNVVIVRGTLDSAGADSGVATSIEFDDVVQGPIETGTIDLAANTFIALGQTVAVSADTSFDDSIQPPSLEGLAAGDIVEVSGFRRSTGVIEATRVDPGSADQLFEVTGLVANLNSASFMFDIAALRIDYSAALIEDFLGGEVRDGDLVEVRGATTGADGELIASRVEFRGDDLVADEGDHVELEGLITRFVDATDFDVAGAPVRTTSATTFEGGVSGDLRLDLKLEVEGELDAEGVLVAVKVDIRRGNVVRVAGVVDTANSGTQSFEVLGIAVSTDELTRIEDKSDLGLRPFSVADLAGGDYVEVRGSESSTGILAGLVERDDLVADTGLRGFVASENGSELVILGVTISTDASTEYRNATDAAISAGEFFGLVGPGSLVDVRGIEVAATTIAADQLQIEIE